MEDKLKKFIQENRDEFDAFEPRPDVWQDICQKLSETKPVINHRKPAKVITFTYAQLWRYAAAVVVLLIAGIVAWQTSRKADAPPVASGQTPSLATVAPEMAEVESYYTSLINERKAELGEFDLRAPGIDDNLPQDVANLDSTYARLKRELYTTPNREKIIEAMIQNLQLRMEILNQQLKTLEQIKTIKENAKQQA